MAPRTTTALLVGLLALSGLSVVAGGVIDAPPELTIENQADTTHRVTAYTVAETESVMELNFAVTTDDGDRRLATLEQLYWPGEFRNVTIADDGVPSQRHTVEPGENVTTTVEAWTPGNVTIYVVEDLGDDQRHVHTDIRTCTEREQEHELRLESDGTGGSYTCASSLDWLLR
ncbi:hypothetical protein [Halomicrobium sp. LC1Hm]|uniref:hypothetical protein n=1 Tax=Halomicrobium sp. LC1Hm TaxID=2610902 RepID=UPI00129839E0|nr:hypothetical protein [Halomicrobium sp. LC1Hm]